MVENGTKCYLRQSLYIWIIFLLPNLERKKILTIFGQSFESLAFVGARGKYEGAIKAVLYYWLSLAGKKEKGMT